MVTDPPLRLFSGRPRQAARPPPPQPLTALQTRWQDLLLPHHTRVFPATRRSSHRCLSASSKEETKLPAVFDPRGTCLSGQAREPGPWWSVSTADGRVGVGPPLCFSSWGRSRSGRASFQAFPRGGGAAPSAAFQIQGARSGPGCPGSGPIHP